ncbi:hypothetical protein SAMN04487907_101895 [Zunongwangia mangrovi]|uniref:Uncharacterized protein n=1 Tax=Zunongwangia mangrovi TaxID=1334022 RepID=A0A1I1EC63_9FLAO|nr:hypothetical protein SAMN04487907_101895 [Zunongwangia mangrovi]
MLKGAEFGVCININLFKMFIINDLYVWFESRPDRKIAKSLSEMKGFFYVLNLDNLGPVFSIKQKKIPS